MSAQTIPVLLADDHPVVRNGLAHVLEATDDIRVVGHAGGGREAIEQTRTLKPTVVVLDYRMPDMDGTQVVAKLKAQHPRVAVIIFTMYESVHYATQALKAGAKGFVVKGDELDEVIEAIRIVGRGGSYITPRLNDPIARQLHRFGEERDGVALLSQREFELVRCRVRGMTLKESAGHMHVSESTASTYQQRTLEKLDLKNVAQLIRYALDHGISG